MTTISELQQMHMQNNMNPQYNEMLHQAYLQQQSQQNYHDNDYSQEELDNILKDINEEEKPTKKKRSKKSKSKSSESYSDKNSNQEKIIDLLKDIGLIVVVYVVLSMPPIKKIFSNYVPQLNKGPDGKVPFMGLVIYGSILGVVVTLIRKYVLKK